MQTRPSTRRGQALVHPGLEYAHLGADAEPLILFVVTDIMFDRSTHSFRLQTSDVSHSQASSQIGVFGETFKIAASKSRPQNGTDSALKALGFTG